MGKHRTEATEGHRGGIGLMGETFAVDTIGLGARNTLNGKASHRGHGGHRGGIGLMGETFAVDTIGLGARNTLNGKASHRGHGGQRRGDWVIGFRDESATGDTLDLGARIRRSAESSPLSSIKSVGFCG